jgi:hypothetical protein
LKDERRRFLEDEWPLVLERIGRLGLSVADLVAAAESDSADSDEGEGK